MSLLLKQYLEETWALRQLKCVLFFFSWFEHNVWHQYHKLFQCYLGIRGNEGRRLLKSHFWFCSFKSYVFQKKWGPNFQVPIVPCWIQIFRKIPFSFTLLNRAFFHKRSAASNSFWPGSHWESWPFFFFLPFCAWKGMRSSFVNKVLQTSYAWWAWLWGKKWSTTFLSEASRGCGR